ncbi:MAG: hypothetical protein AAFQ53_16115, partial [Bacteroidota bacterium]
MFAAGPSGFEQVGEFPRPLLSTGIASNLASLAATDDALVEGYPLADFAGSTGFVRYRALDAGTEVTSEQVLASPFGPDSFFGGLVALDEDVLVVGAPGRTVAGVSGAGSVCIYRQTPSGWALRSTIEPDPAWIVVDYGLGGSLKLRGTELLVGALGGNGSSSTPGRAGLVHHYDLSVAGTPSLTQTLRPPTGGRVTGGYGATIALDHELLLIGEGSSSNDMDGVVFRYERDAPGLPWSWSGTISGPVEGAGSPPFDG